MHAWSFVVFASARGENQLIKAVKEDHEDCLRRFLQSGADTNTADEKNKTVLMHAAQWGRNECMKRLLAAGADVNSTGANRNTALHMSTESRDINCVKILLGAGAHVNKRNQVDQSALEYYLSECSLVTQPIAMLLFAAGEIPDETHLQRYGWLKERYGETHVELPEYLKRKSQAGTLKEMCRQNIRKHLLDINLHLHLFYRISKLQLADSLIKYLLYDHVL